MTAIAEALERYSSCVVDPRQLITATADELGSSALDLDTLPRCSADELADPRCPVTTPSRSARIRWVRGVSLTRRTPVWVPAVLTYLLQSDQNAEETFALPISTGCAAHRSYVEALRSALCEVIERDAISLTWLLSRPLPVLHVDDPSPELATALDLSAGRAGTVRLFDATTDVGVPTVYALDVTPDDPDCAAVVSCAADLDPRRAAAKALREAASTRVGLASTRSSAEDPAKFRSASDGAHYMGHPSRLHAFDFLRTSTRRRLLSDVPQPGCQGPVQELTWLLARLDALGMDVVAVDLTTDEALRVGMRVVRVVVPQLQPLSFSHLARFLGHPRIRAAASAEGHAPDLDPAINPWPQPFA